VLSKAPDEEDLVNSGAGGGVGRCNLGGGGVGGCNLGGGASSTGAARLLGVAWPAHTCFWPPSRSDASLSGQGALQGACGDAARSRVWEEGGVVGGGGAVRCTPLGSTQVCFWVESSNDIIFS